MKLGMFAKIKLLFKVSKPLGDTMKEIQQTKAGWKTPAFWTTLIGGLVSTVLALQGVIPPELSVVLTSVLTAIYNVLRGLKKHDDTVVKGPLITTEFLMTVLGEAQKGIVALHVAGINPKWMETFSTLVGVAFAAGQSLAARTPAPEAPTKNP
jgi:hypothetical protein